MTRPRPAPALDPGPYVEKTNISTTRRLNLRAAAALAILVLALGAGGLALNRAGPGRVGDAATRQIEELDEAGRPDLALRHLGRYLERYPDDEAMLFLQARLMAEQFSDAGVDLIGRVAQLHDRLLRRYPENPEADEVRGRLAELYIRLSDRYRSGFDLVGAPEQAALQARYAAAAKIARELVERRGDDPKSHLLLGIALERLAGSGSRSELDEAIAAFERALGLHERALSADPDDDEAGKGATDVAVLLARLYRDRRGDEQAAMRTMDRLVSARPNAVEVRVARYRYFREGRDAEGAGRELKAALELTPDDPKVRLAAADHALQRGDPAAARAHVEAIAGGGDAARNPELSLVNGMIDLAENQGEQALEQWRQGLTLAYGADADLAWWLAYVQLRLNRIGEADRIIDRYRSLSGGGESPPFRLLLALRDEQFGDFKAAIRALEDLRGDRRVEGRIRNEAILALGRCYQAIGDKGAAERIYALAAQGDKRSSEPIEAQAELLLKTDRPEAAVPLVERALEERGANDPRLLKLLLRCRLAVQLALPQSRRSWEAFDRDTARAEAANQAGAEAEGLDPHSVDLALILADREFLDGRPDQADARLEEALKRWPDNPKIWAARAELKSRSGRPDESIALLERGLGAIDAVSLRLKLARQLVALGRGREAQRRLIAGIEGLEPDQQASLWEAVGRLRMAQADFAGAGAAFLKWEAKAAGLPGPILARIELALLENKLGEAEVLLNRLKTEGEEGDLPYRLAHASLLLRRAELAEGASAGSDADRQRDAILEEANEIIKGVLADARELAQAHFLNGRIQEATGKQGENDAVLAYRQAWERGSVEALPRLADLLARLDRFDELEELASTPGAALSVGRLSTQTLLAAGEVDRAARLLNEAVDDPNAPAAANAWRARMLELAGQGDQLEDLLRREADRATPDDPAPWLRLIAAQSRLGRGRAALEVTVRNALQQAPGVPPALLEAQLRWAAGDIRAADAVLEPALQAPDADPQLLGSAASFYEQTGRPDRAEPLLERLLEVEPLARVAALQLAMLLSGRSANDPETWERALGLVGAQEVDPQHRLARAVVLARAPDPERRKEAIPLLEGLMADLPVMHPRAVEARNQLAHLLIDFGRAEQAVQITAVSASQPAPLPSDVALHVRALMLVGRLVEATAEIDRLELFRPGDPAVAELRAECLLEVGDGAPADLEAAVAERIGSPGGDLFARAAALRLLGTGTPEAIEAAGRVADRLAAESSDRGWVAGLVLAVRGQSAEALSRCAEAVGSADLSDGTDRIGMTDAVLRAVQAAPIADRDAAIERARPIIDAMLERRPGDPDLLIASAVLHRHAGDYDVEAGLYRQALERRPDDSMARYNLALVLSEGLDRPEEGLEQIELLAARIGPNASVLGARGVILTRLGRFDEAIRDLERSLALEPTADRHYYLARAFHKAGREAEFREHLGQARRAGLDPNGIDRWQQDELRQLLSR